MPQSHQAQPPKGNIGKIVRIKEDRGPCFIAGVIETETAHNFDTCKDFNGTGVEHRIPVARAHLEPCEDCPDEDDVEALRPTQATRRLKNVR